jgi:hypothetical protein
MEILTVISLFLFIAIWVFLSIYILRGLLVETPYYPSKIRNLEEAWDMLEIEDYDLSSFVDIGSGDGRVVRWAAGKGMHATGLEINPFLTLAARFFSVFNPHSESIQFLHTDFNKHSFKPYDIVYMYIYKEHMNSLKDKLFSELKPGSIIISNVFKFEGIEPDKTYKKFLLYRVPNK